MNTIIGISKKGTIEDGLRTQIKEVVEWLSSQAAENFEYAPSGKWSTGQQLDHLLKSLAPLNKILGLPKAAIKERFGALDRPVRTYQETFEWYSDVLAKGGAKITNKVVPTIAEIEEKSVLLKRLVAEGEQLLEIIKDWEEDELDSYCIPHPILGNMCVREMLFFTIFHTEHHKNILLSNYPQ